MPRFDEKATATAVNVLFYGIVITLTAVVWEGGSPLRCAVFVLIGVLVRVFWLRDELDELLRIPARK